MENKKPNKGTYTFFKHSVGRPIAENKKLLVKIKDIENKHNELFHEFLQKKGVCTDIKDIPNFYTEVLEYILRNKKRVNIDNKNKTVWFNIRVTNSELNFLTREAIKHINTDLDIPESEQLKNEISRILNLSITNYKSDKKSNYDDFKEIKYKEQALKNRLHPKINSLNYEYIEQISELKNTSKANVIRNCLINYMEQINTPQVDTTKPIQSNKEEVINNEPTENLEDNISLTDEIVSEIHHKIGELIHESNVSNYNNFVKLGNITNESNNLIAIINHRTNDLKSLLELGFEKNNKNLVEESKIIKNKLDVLESQIIQKFRKGLSEIKKENTTNFNKLFLELKKNKDEITESFELNTRIQNIRFKEFKKQISLFLLAFLICIILVHIIHSIL